MAAKKVQTESESSTAQVQIPREVWREIRQRAASEDGATIGGLLVRGWRLLQRLEARAAQRRKP